MFYCNQCGAGTPETCTCDQPILTKDISGKLTYENTAERGRYLILENGYPRVIIKPTTSDEVHKLITAVNNWQEVKRLFLDTTIDTEQFIDAISRMIQEEYK